MRLPAPLGEIGPESLARPAFELVRVVANDEFELDGSRGSRGDDGLHDGRCFSWGREGGGAVWDNKGGVSRYQKSTWKVGCWC